MKTKHICELEENIEWQESLGTKRRIYLWRLIGPKGVGKTAALRYFENLGGHYIDLAQGYNIDAIGDTGRLLIDNAQLYDSKEYPLLFCNKLHGRTVIAAYSPESLHSNTNKLKKAIGDNREKKFFFRPFYKHEAQEFVTKTLEVTISQDKDYKNSQISIGDFNKLFFITGGVPRYLEFGLENIKENEEIMYDAGIDEVIEQYTKASDHHGKVVDCFYTGCCSSGSPLVQLGIVFSEKISGGGKYKLASPYYVVMALERGECCGGLKRLSWQRLEAMAMIMLRYTDCKVLNSMDDFTLTRASTVIYQNELGERCHPVDGTVTLFVLFENHNVLDYIVYDMRFSKKVYYVQVSKLPYGKKKKTKDNLKDVVKKGGQIITSDSIEEVYAEGCVKENRKYIYATSDLKGYKDYPGVFFIDLLALTSATDLLDY